MLWLPDPEFLFTTRDSITEGWRIRGRAEAQPLGGKGVERLPAKGGRWGEWPLARSSATMVMVEVAEDRVLCFWGSNDHRP